MNINVVLEPNHDWNRADYFLNKWMSTRRLGNAKTPWDGLAKLGAGGYPESDFGGVVFTSRPGGGGLYHVAVTGPVISNIFTPACSSKITKTGLNQWDLDLNGGTLFLGFTGVSPGISKISITKSGESGKSYFTQQFLDLLAPFHGFRCMELMETNASAQTIWSSRPQVTDCTWNQPGLGVPLEVLIQLANVQGQNLYLNIPHQADDNYICQMAQLVHVQLDPTLICYFEFSNELWNTKFKLQNQWAMAKANGNIGRFIVDLAVRTSNIVKPILGSRCRIVLATQGANTPLQLDQSAYAAKTWGKLSMAGIDCLAIAPYMGGNVTSTQTAASMVQQFLDQVKRDPQQHLEAVASIARSHNVELISYECGTDFGTGPNSTGRIAVAYSPSMKTAIPAYVQMLSKYCSDIFYYTLTGAFNSSGEWGLTDDVRSHEPKYLGLVSMIPAILEPTPTPTPTPTPVAHANDPQQLILNALSLVGQLGAAKVAAGPAAASTLATAQQLANNILTISKRLFP